MSSGFQKVRKLEKAAGLERRNLLPPNPRCTWTSMWPHRASRTNPLSVYIIYNWPLSTPPSSKTHPDSSHWRNYDTGHNVNINNFIWWQSTQNNTYCAGQGGSRNLIQYPGSNFLSCWVLLNQPPMWFRHMSIYGNYDITSSPFPPRNDRQALETQFLQVPHMWDTRWCSLFEGK